MAVDFTDTKSERDMVAELSNLLDGSFDEDTPIGVASCSDYGDALMTRNHGIVVRLDNGSEFQITVVQSRFADDFDPDDDESDDDA